MTLRRSARTLLGGGLALVVAAPLAIAPAVVPTASAHPATHPAAHHQAEKAGHPRSAAGPSHIDLPNGFAPEGIAIDRDTAYLGSRVNGDLYRVDLRTGRGAVFSKGPGTPSLGLKVDRGLIYVSGGSSGTGRIVDARTGAVKRSITFAADVSEQNPSFVNDVILTKHTAWFTDSLRDQLYGVSLASHRHGKPGHHRATKAPSLTKVTLTRQWKQTPGVNNANGITQTPDHKALIVVKSDEGALYRVSPKSGVATKINLGGETVANGDGLLLRGRTLYVVQNQKNLVAVIKLDRGGRAGTVQRRLTSTDFDVPTTVATRGKSLYLPNARFSTPQTPTTQYWITRIHP